MLQSEIVESKKPNLQRELGVNANKNLVTELIEDISSGWSITKIPLLHPFLLLIGGFQGSGKTSVLEKLSSQLSITTISPDDIRGRLLQKISFSDVFVNTVNAARNRLIGKALATGQNVAIDGNAIPMRISLFRSLASSYKYKVLTVYLCASKDTLIKRLQLRPDRIGKYKGTIGQLKDCMMAYGKPDVTLYDVVFQTEQHMPEEIASQLLKKIKTLQ